MASMTVSGGIKRVVWRDRMAARPASEARTVRVGRVWVTIPASAGTVSRFSDGYVTEA